MKRRYFLAGLTTLGITGCRQLSDAYRLNITLLAGAIPNQFLRQFQRQQGVRLLPKLGNNYAEIAKLMTEGQTETNVSSLGDSWLPLLRDSLQEIDPQSLSNWHLIPSQWRSVGVIDNKLYGIPYRWGTTVIIYNTRQLQKFNIPPLQSWQDLWHPGLKRRISLPDSDREVIGLCLKRRGFSYNQTELVNRTELQADLASLDQQTLTYTSNYYVQSLVQEDTWAAVGWSNDVQEIVKRYPHLKVVNPQEGTALWFDCWAVAKPNPLNPAWIDYCLQPQQSHLITVLTDGIGVTDTDHFLPTAYLNKCEPILPLPPSVATAYQKIWRELRNKPRNRLV
ncbi:MAG: extracellular solute-binding protein [Pseudanabaenaceae cyanobacterium SKYGB_i_bin29]|nr:extracellular solute-binding protein [Pseudanabaenaceae cyanobacterium SKYG29]MDW8422457.1 extracellular solute-binding protein [Pseudanabaenaceae cyanobacterium SKYGB_i_bin29]